MGAAEDGCLVCGGLGFVMWLNLSIQVASRAADVELLRFCSEDRFALFVSYKLSASLQVFRRDLWCVYYCVGVVF